MRVSIFAVALSTFTALSSAVPVPLPEANVAVIEAGSHVYKRHDAVIEDRSVASVLKSALKIGGKKKPAPAAAPGKASPDPDGWFDKVWDIPAPKKKTGLLSKLNPFKKSGS